MHHTFLSKRTVFVGKMEITVYAQNSFPPSETFAIYVKNRRKFHIVGEQNVVGCRYFNIISKPLPPKAATLSIFTEKQFKSTCFDSTKCCGLSLFEYNFEPTAAEGGHTCGLH
jgi:hypothetical protein